MYGDEIEILRYFRSSGTDRRLNGTSVVPQKWTFVRTSSTSLGFVLKFNCKNQFVFSIGKLKIVEILKTSLL